MQMCFDRGHSNNGKIYRQDNTLPINKTLNTFGVQNLKQKDGKANFMNVAVLKKSKAGCGACGGR